MMSCMMLLMMIIHACENPAVNLFDNLCRLYNNRNIGELQRLFTPDAFMICPEAKHILKGWDEIGQRFQNDWQLHSSSTMAIKTIVGKGSFWAKGTYKILKTEQDTQEPQSFPKAIWTLIGEYGPQGILKIAHIQFSYPVNLEEMACAPYDPKAWIQRFVININTPHWSVFTTNMCLPSKAQKYSVLWTIIEGQDGGLNGHFLVVGHIDESIRTHLYHASRNLVKTLWRSKDNEAVSDEEGKNFPSKLFTELFTQVCNPKKAHEFERFFDPNAVIFHVDQAKTVTGWDKIKQVAESEKYPVVLITMREILKQGTNWATGTCDIKGMNEEAEDGSEWPNLNWTFVINQEGKIQHIHWSMPIVKPVPQVSEVGLIEESPVTVVIGDEIITNLFTGVIPCENDGLEYNLCFTIVNNGFNVVHTHWSVPDSWRLFPETKQPDDATIKLAEKIIRAYTKAIESRLAEGAL